MALVPYDNEVYIKDLQNGIWAIRIVSEKMNDLKLPFETLGIYVTKERVLKVLDEIEEAILSANMIVCAGCIIEKVPPQNVVYQMPSE